jgi:UDP-3-O-[3-hydroxymyristoyl] N-acetylglucosamine deacetylase/3-hydroxyacyl-[acyl-carrier-protein] dehydratase
MRKTISKEVVRQGIGLHTGAMVEVKLIPAKDSLGIKFVRGDVSPDEVIPADISYVNDTSRCTRLKKGESEIHTVEHILAALKGNGIDDVIIELSGPEIPILDGSAQAYVDMILEAGIEDKDGDKDVLIVSEEFRYEDEVTGAEYIVLPSDRLEVTVMIDFPDTDLSFQFAQLDDLSQFNNEIANARTFVFSDEILALAERDLIKGGDLSNAIVIPNGNLTNEKINVIAEKLGKDAVTITENGILGGQEWTSKNEPARHKLLDVIGDLALVGVDIHAKIIAKKPGHKSNAAFAKVLKRKYQEQRRQKGRPHYDPNIEPVLDIEGVKKLLPHRYPFLLVDKIIEVSESRVVGVKNVTSNESFFQGHFPDNPVFPGVLQMEALAQTGGILALSGVEDPNMWDTYFLKMDNVKFKNKVVPGDTLLLKMELLTPIRRGIVHMQGTAYVGSKIVSEGELIAQIIKRSS